MTFQMERGNNIFHRLKRTELDGKPNPRARGKYQIFSEIPSRLVIPLEDILDSNKEITKSVILGFTKDGNYLGL